MKNKIAKLISYSLDGKKFEKVVEGESLVEISSDMDGLIVELVKDNNKEVELCSRLLLVDKSERV